MTATADQPSLTRREAARQKVQFRWYMAASSSWSMSFGIQNIIVSLILVGVLDFGPLEVGNALAVAGLPGILFMLIGGVTGDKMDPRKMLMAVHIAGALPPLTLAFMAENELLGFWSVIAASIGFRITSSFGMPARSSYLNYVAGSDLQKAISVSMIFQTVTQMAGAFIASLADEIEALFWQLAGADFVAGFDYLGITSILIIQAGIMLVGFGLVWRLSPDNQRIARAAMDDRETSRWGKREDGEKLSAIQELFSGFPIVWDIPIIRNIVLINFAQGVFNNGTLFVALPIIMHEVYGDLSLFPIMMMWNQGGSGLGAWIITFFTPILQPGRLLMIAQLTRAVLMIGLFFGPPVYWVFGLMVLWGFNMSISWNMARSVVQEEAPEEHRSKVMSVFSLGFMGAMPIGAFITGALIEMTSPLDALLLGPFGAILVFVVAYRTSGIWEYRAVMHEEENLD